MKKQAAVLCALSLAICAIPAQVSGTLAFGNMQNTTTGVAQDKTVEAQERLLLATSSLDYPVTPSDIYTLTFFRNTGDPTTQRIQVASDFSVDLGIFGKIDARELTFPALKARVETKVAQSYSRSYPSLMIQTVGIFRVGVSGAIARPRFEIAWGLSRLSEIFNAVAEPDTSMRSIELRKHDGKSKRFDLLKAASASDESQNPIVKPGDSIILSAITGVIQISGAIRHAGSYELLPGESLRDLVEKFGGGLSNIADTSKIRIDRITAGGWSALYIDLSTAYDPPISLEGCITVSIPSRMDNRPFVWFEGAILPPQADSSMAKNRTDTQTKAYAGEGNRVSLQIYDGEMLSEALLGILNSISPSADLSSASLFRQWSNAPIIIDLQPLIDRTNTRSDIQLLPHDRIYIPIRGL